MDEYFSEKNLNYVRVHYEHLVGKRSSLARSPAVPSAAPSSQKAALTALPTPKAAPVAPKKRKRETVDESKKICTMQALFELDKDARDGHKACTRANCTGHYGFGTNGMAKREAMALLEKYSSNNSFNRLKRQVEKFYG